MVKLQNYSLIKFKMRLKLLVSNTIFVKNNKLHIKCDSSSSRRETEKIKQTGLSFITSIDRVLVSVRNSVFISFTEILIGNALLTYHRKNLKTIIQHH